MTRHMTRGRTKAAHAVWLCAQMDSATVADEYKVKYSEMLMKLNRWTKDPNPRGRMGTNNLGEHAIKKENRDLIAMRKEIRDERRISGQDEIQ